MSYDRNGNILALNREGLLQKESNAPPVYGTVDALSSQAATDFEGNRLLRVTDGQATQGLAGDFQDGNTSGSDYTYDAAGSLTADRNRGITGITYNALGLPVRVSFGADQLNYIEYDHDAGGGKLAKKLYRGGMLAHTTEYMGGFVYENGELLYMHTAEGRYVFKAPDNVPYYEYHYTDQSGHMRVAFRDPAPALTHTATLEDALAATENAAWANTAATRDAGRACTGTRGARVNATRVLGPWKTIAVGRGDRVRAFARAVYQAAPTGTGVPLGLYLAGAGAAAGSGGEGAGNKLPLLQLGVGFAPAFTQPAEKPRAYLQYILYDRNEKYLTQGRRLLAAAANTCEELQLELTVPEDGYVQVLVANESTADVWFDDIEITRTPTMIVQEAHYDPWGMSLAGIEKEGDFAYLFNLSEKQPDATGRGYSYETDWRGYDPQLGRFRGVDMLAAQMPGINPYQYAYNNPVMANDPTGLVPVLAVVRLPTFYFYAFKVTAAHTAAAAAGAGMGGCNCACPDPPCGGQAAQVPQADPQQGLRNVPVLRRMPDGRLVPRTVGPPPTPGTPIGGLLRGMGRAMASPVGRLAMGAAGAFFMGTQPTGALGDTPLRPDPVRPRQWDFDRLTPEELRQTARRWQSGQGDGYDNAVMDYFDPENKGKQDRSHHFASNKNNVGGYTDAFKKIAAKYGLNLDSDWNIEDFPKKCHNSKHHPLYHDFVLRNMLQADMEAKGDTTRFVKLFDLYVKQP